MVAFFFFINDIWIHKMKMSSFNIFSTEYNCQSIWYSYPYFWQLKYTVASSTIAFNGKQFFLNKKWKMNENEPDKNWICSPEYYSGYSQHDSSIKNTSVYTKELLFHGAEGSYSPQILLHWKKLDAVFLQNLQHVPTVVCRGQIRS